MIRLAVLSDSDILALIRNGGLRIEGFQESNLTPNGYDMTIDEVWVPSTNVRKKEGEVRVPPSSWFVIGTREYLVLPDTLVGEIWIRTSWVRKGILSSFGRIDAGFNGNLTFSAYNASTGEVPLGIGDRFAQVVFEELRTPPAKSYRERSGNYQGQRGITLKPKQDQTNCRSNP